MPNNPHEEWEEPFEPQEDVHWVPPPLNQFAVDQAANIWAIQQNQAQAVAGVFAEFKKAYGDSSPTIGEDGFMLPLAHRKKMQGYQIATLFMHKLKGDKPFSSEEIIRLHGEAAKGYELPFDGKEFTGQFALKTMDVPTNVGIEVEVENCDNIMHEGWPVPSYWAASKDGSLRSKNGQEGGLEAISPILKAKDAGPAVAFLFWKLNRWAKPSFSWRTSIHVHVGVRNLTVEEVGRFIALYLIFEAQLFQFAGKNRNESIFCVPLLQTGVPEDVVFQLLAGDFRDMNDVLGNWHKYSALGAFRIREYGTLEFRHMEGLNDPRKVVQWINLILSLYQACRQIKTEELLDYIKNLNTNSEYWLLKKAVFLDYAHLLSGDSDYGMPQAVARLKQICRPLLSKVRQKSSGEDSGIATLLKKIAARKALKSEDGSPLNIFYK